MYFERYLNGEYEQVWRELCELGPKVRQEDVYQDALNVVQETMRRVRKNIETLIFRLIDIGFVFGYDHRLSAIYNKRFDPMLLESSTIMENTYLHAFFLAKTYPPIFLATDLAQRNRNELLSFSGSTEEPENALLPDMKKYLYQLEKEVGVLPLSIKAWYEEIGAINFYGFHDVWAKWYYDRVSSHTGMYYDLMSFCDPLFVYPLTQDWKKHLFTIGSKTPFQSTKGWEFAPDSASKDLFSGGPSEYLFALPDAGTDVVLLDVEYSLNQNRSTTFVEYLRFCLSWAGFPGMSRWSVAPIHDIATLTHNLLPF